MCPGISHSFLLDSSTLPSELDSTILSRLVDVHCHPIDEKGYDLNQLNLNSKLKAICVMSSTISNQTATRELYEMYPEKIVPCYGLHPWFTHHISLKLPTSLSSRSDTSSTPNILLSKPSSASKIAHYASLFPTSPSDPTLHPSLLSSIESMPNPVPLAEFLKELELNLSAASGIEGKSRGMLGEVGLDGAFKIPLLHNELVDNAATVSEEGNSRRYNLSTLSTHISHQLVVLEAQIDLAIRLRRNISFHSVRSTKETLELLSRLKSDQRRGFSRIHLCLHSFGGSPESAREVQRDHSNVFFSFATIISGRSPKFYDLVRMIEPDRILLESDYDSASMLDTQMMEVFEAVCEAKQWGREECVIQLEKNWERFTSEPVIVVPKKSKRERRLEGKSKRT